MTSLVAMMLVSGGTIDPNQLKAAVRKNHPAIIGCFADESKRDPKLQGEVDVFFKLLETGKPSAVAIKKTTLKNKPTETCLVKVVGEMTFPKPTGGTIDITYPFVFEPAIVEDTPPPPPKVPGSMPRDKLIEVITSNKGNIRDCYDREKAKTAGEMKGTIDTEFLVEQDGHVSEAKVVKSTLNNAAVETCLVGVLKQLKFPKPDGETGVRIGFPFNF